MEDLFAVEARTSPGLDGQGHLGFAAQPGPGRRSGRTCSTTRPDSTPAGENGICHAPREPGQRPGSRGAGFRAAAAALGVAVVAVAGITAFVVTRPGPPPAPVQTYGGLPSWLPKPSVPVGRVVTASAAHPKLAIQGDTVRVLLTGAQVLATAVGPQVPEEGKFPVPEATRCTFTITFAKATGTFTLRAADFAAVDERGQLHRLRLHLRGGGPLPG